jgi:hypothetical protein
MNIYVHIFMWTYVFISLQQICRSGISRHGGQFSISVKKNSHVNQLMRGKVYSGSSFVGFGL